MFPIYLLEDNDIQREYYKGIIENTIMINDYPMNLTEAKNTKSFFDVFTKSQYGLFFLDMEMDNDTQAGLKISEFVRENMPDAKIVFITTHEELSFLTLERKISPMDYILKDLSSTALKEKIIEDIELAQKYYQDDIYQKGSTFGYKIGSKYFSVPMKELILLHTEKSLPGQVSLESVNRHAAFPGSLNALEKEYDNLLRVDKSSLVNIDKIVSYDSRKRILYLADDISCNVSFRKSPKVSQVFVKKD